MLRPASILSVLLFGAFALLLLAVISTPIVKGIPLGSFRDVTFGVFGYCAPDGCTGVEIGYDPTALLPNGGSNFDLPSGVRDALTTILIVHPVAALLTLVMFVMSVVAHLRAPSHSARYLLIVFIVSVLTLLVCLLAFVVDVLLFIPHLAWGSYIVLAATIMVALSGLMTCVMRRTLISRKTRQQKIAQNAEMSGENYYNREAQKAATTMALQPTMPVVSSGANGNGDALPVFASFENKTQEDKASEEHIPLRQPSDRSQNTTSPVNAFAAPEPMRSNSVPLRDQYGNPMGPSADDYALRRGPSSDRMNAGGRGGMPPPGFRGNRGGYGRGGYGGPPPRGGYGPSGRGGYGPPRGGYGPRGGPMMRGGGRSPYQNYNGGGGPYDRRPSPADGYGPGPYGRNDPYNNSSAPNLGAGGGYDAYSSASSLPRAESPPPLSDAPVPMQQQRSIAEMDSTPANTSNGSTQLGTIRDSDTDVAGMVGLQQARSGNARPTESYMSDSSKYSGEDPQGQYIPPRAAWNQAQGRHSPSVPSPLAVARSPNQRGRSSPDTGGVAYYEDVDARYAVEPSPQPHLPPQQSPPPQRYDNGYSDPRARSPNWGGYQGGRPTPQTSNPDLQNRSGTPGRSPPPGMSPNRGYPHF